MKPFITNFNIRVLEKDGNDELFSYKGRKLLDIMSDTSLFSFNELEVCADPFLFIHQDRLFLFYEKQYKLSGKGYLCMVSTTDLVNWSPESIVLKEKFHLSFPFVFEDDGHVYMVPESSNDYSIRLYEATDSSLMKWNYVKNLVLEEDNWVDSSIILHDNCYYLFTTTTQNGIQSQRLFFSEKLTNTFVEHPCSPIYIGNDCGRNGGSILAIKDDLYRPAQDCVGGYGTQINILKIDMLSQTEYREHIHRNNIIDTSMKFYKGGGHQFNMVQYNDRVIVATDAKTKNYNLIETIRRIVSHF